ncbi:cytochrome P450 [Mycobacterium heckeshornense]|uniref:cytochrome P450 n=1 Tax=Mycobacterium heckeshornense TaxID=110505 RepID=UPI001941BC3C|nr:cytochrome P450 [Mycobacterium heckeshornense]BCQ07410.1 cytochrome P450 [Mycobacterium heckeshornense]
MAANNTSTSTRPASLDQSGGPRRLTAEEVAYFADHFDHHHPAFGQDPYPVYERMQSRCPVTYSDDYGGFWVVTGFDEARYAWQHPELFSTQPSVSVPHGLGNKRPMLPLEVDPPLHTKHRRLLSPVFAPNRIAGLEPKIRKVCNELIDAFIDRGECELIAELAQPLPTRIFVDMLGIPADEAGAFRNWNHAILHGQHDDPTGQARARAGAEARARLADILAERKRTRRDDILSVLLDSEIDGQRLDDEEILDHAFLLFLAGLDTVQGAIGFQFMFLSQHPGHRDRLAGEPRLIPRAVEELLRWEGLNISGRNATRDTVLAGVKIAKGDPVVLVNRSAGRDPRVFTDPNRVDFDRPIKGSLAFGAGPHRCVGSHLARLELRVVHEQMHKRVPDYRLRPGHQVRIHGGNVAGVDALPLVWG